MLKLAIPIMLANISVPLVGVVDTAVMGRMSDPMYLGATAIGATIFSSIFWLFGFLRMGTGGIIAQAYGAKDTVEIQQSAMRALTIAALLGVLIVSLQIPLFFISQHAFTTSEALLGLVRDYFDIRIYSAPATLMNYALLGSLIGLQRMGSVMAVQLFLNLANIALNLFFFIVMDWGIQGVALASVTAEYLALGLSLTLLSRQVPLSFSVLKHPDFIAPAAIKRLMQVSTNLFIRTLCLIAAFYWLTARSSALGIQILAANTILIQIIHLMAYGLDGFSHAAETLGGNAYGRRDKQAFIGSVRASTEWATIMAILITAGLWFGGTLVIASITTLPEVRHLAELYLPWVIFAPLLSVWGFLLDGIFIGVTRTKEMRNGMIISLALFIASSVVLLHWFGNHGLWASYYVLMFSRAATLLYWFPTIGRAMAKTRV